MNLDHLGLLDTALTSAHGIVVETNSVERLRAALYRIRATSPDYACLSFSPSPINPSHLWIVKNGTQDDRAPAEEAHAQPPCG